MQQASQNQFCDITGVEGYQQLDRCGGVQWPWSEQDVRDASGCDPQQQRRLFADGIFPTPNSRANLMVDIPASMPEPACKEFSLPATDRTRYGQSLAYPNADQQESGTQQTLSTRSLYRNSSR